MNRTMAGFGVLAMVLVAAACSDDSGKGTKVDAGGVDAAVDVGVGKEVGPGKEAGPGKELGPAPDSGIDPKTLACDKVPGVFKALLAVPANRACNSVADCVMVTDFYYYASCGCYPLLTGGGVGVNKSIEKLADALLLRFHTGGCKSVASKYTPKLCDAAPSINLRCESGKCAVTSKGCHPPPKGDAGV